MAMRKAGSRRVVVDGQTYLWRVRRSPTYSQANCWSPQQFTVQHAGGGAALVVVCRGPRQDNWFGRPGVVVTPRTVADSVRRAAAAGWRADGPDPTFTLVLS